MRARRNSSMRASNPGSAAQSAIDTVRPIGKSPGPARNASTARRCAATSDRSRVDSRRGPACGRGEQSPQVAHHRHDVGLVDRAGHPDAVAETFGDHFREAGEAVDDRGVGPTAVGGGPTRRGEVVQCDDRKQLAFVARVEDAGVVVEAGVGELALVGLDARPLDREAVRAEPEVAQDVEVLGVAVELVDRVARRLLARRPRRVLPRPPVVVPVVALDLVRRRRVPQRKSAGKSIILRTQVAERREISPGSGGKRRATAIASSATTAMSANTTVSVLRRLRSSDAAAATIAPATPVPRAAPSTSLSCTDDVAASPTAGCGLAQRDQGGGGVRQPHPEPADRPRHHDHREADTSSTTTTAAIAIPTPVMHTAPAVASVCVGCADRRGEPEPMTPRSRSAWPG